MRGLLILLFFILTGCISPKMRLNSALVPLIGVIEKAKLEAKTKIEEKGLVLEKAAKYLIFEESPTCEVNGRDCFLSCYHENRPVMAYTQIIGGQVFITIASNNGIVDYQVLVHEFAHYWLIVNYGDYGHDIKFRRSFLNWHD
jgi:hypothetical protein